MEQKVKPPAVALAVLAGLDVLFALIGLVFSILVWTQPETWRLDPGDWGVRDRDFTDAMEQVLRVLDGPVNVVWNLLQIAVSAFVLFTAFQMGRLRTWSLAVAGSALALVPCLTPCYCCFLKIPVAVWCLIVLFRPEVRAAFKS